MFIEIGNPKTIKEKVDAASILIEQMYLAHMVRDDVKFNQAHKKAGDLLFDVMQELDTEQNK